MFYHESKGERDYCWRFTNNTIIIITSTILIKSLSKDKKTTLNYSNQEQVSYKENYYQNFI